MVTDGISGHTLNYLEIPTTFKNGQLEIKLRGDVKVSLGVDGGAQKWRYVCSLPFHALRVSCLP